MINLTKLYGKCIQVLAQDWKQNAVGIMQESPLGPEFIKLVPLPKEHPVLKETQTGGVAHPLHLHVSDIHAIFELD